MLVPAIPRAGSRSSPPADLRTGILVAASIVAVLFVAGLWAGATVSNRSESEDTATATEEGDQVGSEVPGADRVPIGDAAPGASVINVRLLIDEPRDEPDLSIGPTLAGRSISEFGYDIFEAVAANAEPTQNVVVSPASVAIALAMLEPGAVGDAQQQLRSLLRIEDAAEWHASMNALEQSLEARVVESPTPGSTTAAPPDPESSARPTSRSDQGEITVRIANGAYLQDGFPFEAAYLDAIGSNYGPVLNTVDFVPDPDAVAREINEFVAREADDRITDLLKAGDISPDTVLALVNAIFLKASWLKTFEPAATTDGPFTRLDGTDVDVPMMNGWGTSSAEGSGWIGATKSTVGGLSVQFILPDERQFDDVAADLPSAFSEYDESRTGGGVLALPRFETRTSTRLDEALQSLGLLAPYEAADLLGIADEPRLAVDKVIHEAFVAMDETGLEAAAATSVLVGIFSGPSVPPVPVVLDRPFIFRVIDDVSGATLFLGRILDPTS